MIHYLVQDELLATPMAFRSLHEEMKDESKNESKKIRLPRRHAGHKRIGEERPALVVAQGALAPGTSPRAQGLKKPVFSMENALTEGFKYP